MSSTTTVFITVPHATCPPFQMDTTVLHPCDTLSKTVASALSVSLSNSGFENLMFIGNVPRTETDLNRERSRDTTTYRINLTKQMSEKRPSAVLDVHSYPSNGSGFPYDSEIVILDSALTSPKQYSTDLYNILQRSGIKAHLIPGSEVNDIEREARLVYGLRAVLLEFNESLSTSRLKEISNVIAKWV